MINRIAIALLGLVLAAPAAALAQQPGAAQMDPEVQAMLTELQQIHTQLEEVQREALQDPELSAMQEEIGAEIMVAMAEVDPGLDGEMERITALETEARAAQEAGNVQRLQELVGEAQQIQGRFLEVQQEVMERPEVSQMVDGFQTQLQLKMVELDPSIEPLLQRFRELEGQVAEAMQQGG